MPPNCRLALDVGCGRGELAGRATQVIAIDADAESLSFANVASAANPNVTFLKANFLTHPFQSESFDFISMVATLHHMDLNSALARLQQLLKPGGVLAIVGLCRRANPRAARKLA